MPVAGPAVLLSLSLACMRTALTFFLSVLISFTKLILAIMTRWLSALCKALSRTKRRFNASTLFSKYSFCRWYSLVISASRSPLLSPFLQISYIDVPQKLSFCRFLNHCTHSCNSLWNESINDKRSRIFCLRFIISRCIESNFSRFSPII